MEVAVDLHRLLAVLRVVQQDLVQLLQPVVRHGRVDVVRQVVVLAHREDGEVDERG